MTPEQVAESLGRSRASVLMCAQRIGIAKRKLFTEEEKAYVIAHQTDSCQDVATAIGRPLEAVYDLRQRLGLSRKKLDFGPEFEKYLREKYAAGWSDAEIAQGYGCDRHTVGDFRERFGLPPQPWTDHQRKLVGQRTKEQCRKAGVKSLAEVRRLAFKKYARAYGWPEDLLPRQVQMLNALLRFGPMTRRQIAEAVGMPWKGSRKSLVGNVPSGTYLYDLIERGLVVNLGRVVKGKGSGYSRCLYSIPVFTQRSADGQQAAQAG
jgi:hypothetical protein